MNGPGGKMARPYRHPPGDGGAIVDAERSGGATVGGHMASGLRGVMLGLVLQREFVKAVEKAASADAKSGPGGRCTVVREIQA